MRSKGWDYNAFSEGLSEGLSEHFSELTSVLLEGNSDVFQNKFPCFETCIIFCKRLRTRLRRKLLAEGRSDMNVKRNFRAMEGDSCASTAAVKAFFEAFLETFLGAFSKTFPGTSLSYAFEVCRNVFQDFSEFLYSNFYNACLGKALRMDLKRSFLLHLRSIRRTSCLASKRDSHML